MVDDHETTSSPVVDHETGNVSDKELVALLRINVPYEAPRCLQAADRIEALRAEVEQARLAERAAIVAWLDRLADLYAGRGLDNYVALEDIAENIRLEEHLK